jgi:hypothetical protein
MTLWLPSPTTSGDFSGSTVNVSRSKLGAICKLIGVVKNCRTRGSDKADSVMSFRRQLLSGTHQRRSGRVLSGPCRWPGIERVASPRESVPVGRAAAGQVNVVLHVAATLAAASDRGLGGALACDSQGDIGVDRVSVSDWLQVGTRKVRGGHNRRNLDLAHSSS